jgi:hypothetical protein
MESRGKPKTGFPLLSTGLGNRSRDSHISTAPIPVRLIPKDETKGDILGYRLGSSPGSSFDWKTLGRFSSPRREAVVFVGEKRTAQSGLRSKSVRTIDKMGKTAKLDRKHLRREV